MKTTDVVAFVCVLWTTVGMADPVDKTSAYVKAGGWSETMLASRAAVLQRLGSAKVDGQEKDAILKATWQSMVEDFPVQARWFRQDVRGILPAADCWLAKTDARYLREIVGRVVSQTGAAREIVSKQLSILQSGKAAMDERRWLELYAEACLVRDMTDHLDKIWLLDLRRLLAARMLELVQPRIALEDPRWRALKGLVEKLGEVPGREFDLAGLPASLESLIKADAVKFGGEDALGERLRRNAGRWQELIRHIAAGQESALREFPVLVRELRDLQHAVLTISPRMSRFLAQGAQAGLEQEWFSQFTALEDDIRNRAVLAKLASQTFKSDALILEQDRDPADVVLRRTAALLDELKRTGAGAALVGLETELAELQSLSKSLDVTAAEARYVLYAEACRLRRAVVFANPLLNFDRIVFIKRHFCPNAEKTGNHMCDQYFGFNAICGGGLFILEKPFSDQPVVRDVLEKSVCRNGRLKGRPIDSTGGFLSPELSFDAQSILFAWTEIAEQEQDRRRYQPPGNEHNTYKIFRVGVDGSELAQLTDGPWNDFDPCFLPSGRIMFISSRRGGYGRCHGRPVPSFTLHSMNADGSDIVTLSPHETNEWQPSVNHDGMVVYTRWDYVDRGFNQAHHAWTTTPDGRDPRAIHGNYSPDQKMRPHMEMGVRAVPGSRKYIATAACHHGQAYGSIVLIDPSIPDDNAMAAVKRLTPEQLFPEAEIGTHGPPANYAAPYPLSETFFLCVYDPHSRSDAGTKNSYGIYLADAFGNKELLYRDSTISCLDPIALCPRPTPPRIPHQMAVGKPLEAGEKFVPLDPKTLPGFGCVGVMNVYDSLYPMPRDVKITHLRIIQLLPKTTPIADSPRIGYGRQKSARMVLGTVPVEGDGSAFFKLPADRPVYFQALDADGLAVQSMRSATYVHPGETLTCQGCHNNRFTAPRTAALPQAMRRPASGLSPEPAGSKPFSYPILVQPVLDKYCVACHEKSRAAGKGAPDLSSARTRGWFASYDSLRRFAFFWDNPGFDPIPATTPGQFGTRASKLHALLRDGHHGLKLPKDDLHRITLWLDCNSDFFGSYENLQQQLDGKVVPPTLE